ncbi:MAG: LON peptidase substrate-binding domain-containing protein [Pseudomonadales bacterium]
MAELHDIPLFPLRTVLFKDGHLPLRIFEPRYVDMIRHCLREDSGFGVVLIREGHEAKLDERFELPRVFQIGTEARIVDFNQLSDGLLGIVARGERKFRLVESWTKDDLLIMGRVEYLADEPTSAMPDEHGDLVTILRELVQHPLIAKLDLDIDFGEARCVSCRLAELLPIEPEIKQSLLQLTRPGERLAELNRLVHKLRS